MHTWRMLIFTNACLQWVEEGYTKFLKHSPIQLIVWESEKIVSSLVNGGSYLFRGLRAINIIFKCMNE